MINENELIEAYLNKKYDFRLNEITNRGYYKTKEENEYTLLKSYQFNSIYRELKNNGHRITTQGLKSILESDFVKCYNPIQDYLNSLPKWDNTTDYIGQLCDTVRTKNDILFRWAFQKWFIAYVACALEDEIINHSSLILTGKQGIGKTTWLLNLVPRELIEYRYTGKVNPSNKDSNLLLTERILINMDELASYNKNQIDAFKELITKDIVSERRAYGHFTEDYVRRASFVGSANHNDILIDVTGNRRFLVFEAIEIDFNHKVDLKMVYSQALAMFKSGFQFYFDQKEIKRIEEHNKNFKQTSMEEEYIEKYFRVPDSVDAQVVYMNATEVIEFIKGRAKGYLNLNIVTIGKLLTAKGFPQGRDAGVRKYILELI